MNINLSSGEVATILRALKAFKTEDEGYAAYARDLITVLTARWETIRPGDEEVIGTQS